MLLSSVGFPLPEEVTLISVGLIANIGMHPDRFPPPYEGATAVDPVTAAIVAFLVVVFCDTLIYSIGRFFGRRVLSWKPVQSVLSAEAMSKVESWTHKYGAYACGIFRFTPGVRFPGHIACGMMRFSIWKFVAIDSIAAAISVPTQIYLVAIYGESILAALKKVKLFLFVALFGFAIYIGWKWYRKRRSESTNAMNNLS